jgi:hypothetical protein
MVEGLIEQIYAFFVASDCAVVDRCVCASAGTSQREVSE